MICIVGEYVDIKVVYALRDQQWLINLKVVDKITLIEAVKLSGLLQYIPEKERNNLNFGINGRVKPQNTFLNFGDRVEIYRPRFIDPKQLRKIRSK
jgi:hypothetical protein